MYQRLRIDQPHRWVIAGVSALTINVSCSTVEQETDVDACNAALTRTIELSTPALASAPTRATADLHRAQIRAAVGPEFLADCNRRTNHDREGLSSCVRTASSAHAAARCGQKSDQEI